MAKFKINDYLEESGNYGATYRKLFNDLGLMESFCYSEVLTIITTETFEKRGRKCYPKTATECKVKVADMKFYLNAITGKLFFHDHVVRNQTRFGYIPYTMTCHNDSNTTKVKRTFKYIDVADLRKAAGWYENDILDNLASVSYDYCNGYEVLTLRHADGEHICQYSLKNKVFC